MLSALFLCVTFAWGHRHGKARVVKSCGADSTSLHPTGSPRPLPFPQTGEYTRCLVQLDQRNGMPVFLGWCRGESDRKYIESFVPQEGCHSLVFNASFQLQCIPEGSWSHSCHYVSLTNGTLCAQCQDGSGGRHLACRMVFDQQCAGKTLENVFGTLQCLPSGPYLDPPSSCTVKSVSTEGQMCAQCLSRGTLGTFCINISSTQCSIVEVGNRGSLTCLPGGPWRSSCKSPRQGSSPGTFLAFCWSNLGGYESFFSCLITLASCAPLSLYNFNGALQCKPFPPGRWNQTCRPNTFDDGVLCVSTCYNLNMKASGAQCINATECLENKFALENVNGTLMCVPGGPWTAAAGRASAYNETHLCVNNSCIAWLLCLPGTLYLSAAEQVLLCKIKPTLPAGPWQSTCAPLSYSEDALCADCFLPGSTKSFTSCLSWSHCTSVYNVNGTLACPSSLPPGPWSSSCVATSLTALFVVRSVSQSLWRCCILLLQHLVVP